MSIRITARYFILIGLLLALPARATEVGLVGIFTNKAVLVIDGGTPRTLSVGGKTAEGVKLIAVESGVAVVEIDGKRQKLEIGKTVFTTGSAAEAAQVTLNADGRGHFLTVGSVNGAAIRFLVDTGASMVSLGAADAGRANIDYRKGEPGMTQTANGVAPVWRVKLNTVRIGDVVLRDVDALVHGQDLPFALLGMSFLRQMEIKNEGTQMTLRRRY